MPLREPNRRGERKAGTRFYRQGSILAIGHCSPEMWETAFKNFT
jgi:hypothetical protein